jgi:hypothetical protein
MTMTQTTQSISSTLIAARAKKLPVYKAFVLPSNFADVEALILNIPFRSKGAIEVRDIAKRLGASFDGTEWSINRSRLEGATGQECLDTLNALRIVEGVKLIERQRVARGIGIKTIYLKVPYDQRLLAAADGARWDSHPAVRRWVFDVVPNDSAFSALISKWEELGMVDADLTETSLGNSSISATAKALRPMTATVQQFSATATSLTPPPITTPYVVEHNRDLYTQMLTGSPSVSGNDLLICSKALLHRSALTPTTLYAINCFYLNSDLKTSVPQRCQDNPIVLVYSQVWENCPTTSNKREELSYNKAYYIEAATMRKFWDAAIRGFGFVVEAECGHSKNLMIANERSLKADQVKTVAWGLLHDPIFTMARFHKVSV